MLGGAARFQRINVMAAIAAAYVRGMRYDDIRAGLHSFFPSPALTPGRLNMVYLRSGARVLVDYAHNAAAVDGLVDMVLRLPVARRVGVIAVPGDRRDQDIRAVGRLAARLDAAIVKEDADLRGRAPGETAALVAEGLRTGGMAEHHIEIVPEETDAVARGLERLGEDDLLVVLADKVGRVLAQVRAHAATT
jgi:cyanophycin synthetase